MIAPSRQLVCYALLMVAACGLPGNVLTDGTPLVLTPSSVPETSVPDDPNDAGLPPPAEPSNCPAATPNELDVGTICTPTGGECDKTKAPFCTAAFTAYQPPYCTRSCKTADDCGSGMACIASPTNKKTFWCVPTGCVPLGYATDVVGPGLEACLPPTGNSRGLGRPCSGKLTSCLKEGLQLCTTSLIKTAPLAMCTKLCKVNADCGEDMACGPAPGASIFKVCIPAGCLP